MLEAIADKLSNKSKTNKIKHGVEPPKIEVNINDTDNNVNNA